MNRYLILFAIVFLFSCQEEENLMADGNFDVFLVIGQSNTHFGEGLDRILDAPHQIIKQLGRFGKNNLKVIDAQEPLDHHTKQSNRIGFALTFAKLYVEQFLAEDRRVSDCSGWL